MDSFLEDPKYQNLILELKEKVHAAQIRAALSVNRQLIELYWEIGKLITKKQKDSNWGDSIIPQIAQDLSKEFKNIKGFSRSNIYYIKQWYKFYKERNTNIQQLVGQIPWGHNILIINKIKNVDEAIWYINKTIENTWSRSILQIQIEKCLYKRQQVQKKVQNFSKTLPKEQSDLAKQTLKDPYIFDFLSVGKGALERDIEKDLVDHITKFLLELGQGFAFVGKQYHLEVGDENFYIDLLFYHLKLHCYFAIELKTGKFKPEYAGKINFYLSALDDLVKSKEDNPSIGMVLCKDKDNVVGEYALRDMSKPIGISEYKMTKYTPKSLETDLPSVEKIELELKRKIN